MDNVIEVGKITTQEYNILIPYFYQLATDNSCHDIINFKQMEYDIQDTEELILSMKNADVRYAAENEFLQIIANGLTTVPTHTLMDFILDYVGREPVERIVVGLPKQMNNEPSENMIRIEPFVNRLRKVLPNIPVEYVDERFTSVLAQRTIRESGIGKMARRDKALVDKVSAAIILQDYMASNNGFM